MQTERKPDTTQSRLNRGTLIRTTYYRSQTGRIVRYQPVPSYYNSEIELAYYVVKFDDDEFGKGGSLCVHRDMMVVRNEQ